MSTFYTYNLPTFLTKVQALLAEHGLSFSPESLDYDHDYLLDAFRDHKERETGLEYPNQALVPFLPDYKATLNPVAPMEATFLCARFQESMYRRTFQQWVRRLHEAPRDYRWFISIPPDSSLSITPNSLAPNLKSALAFLYMKIRDVSADFPSVQVNSQTHSFSFASPGHVIAQIERFQYTDVAPSRRVDAQRRCEYGAISEPSRIGSGLRRIQGVQPPPDQEDFLARYGYWGPEDEPTLLLPHLSTKSVSATLVRILEQYIVGHKLPKTLGYECAARLLGFQSWHALVQANKRHGNNPLSPQALEIRDIGDFSPFDKVYSADPTRIAAQLQIYRQFSDGLVDLGELVHRVGSENWNWTYTSVHADLHDGRTATLGPCGLEPNSFADIEHPSSDVINLADKIDALNAATENYTNLQSALMSPDWSEAFHAWAEQREREATELERALYEADDDA